MLPRLYRRCESMLANTHVRDVERVRGGLPSGISLNEAVVAMRAEMTAVLGSWAALVVDERGVGQPPARDVPALACFLNTHVEWLARHSAAADAASEIAAMVQDAENMLLSDSAARMELGPCDRADCDGVVTVAVGRNGRVASRTVTCDRGHVCPPTRWLMLKDEFDQASRATQADPSHRMETVR